MANNDTDVPRCPICGQYMEKEAESRRASTYECCGETRTTTKPEWRVRERRQQVR